MFDRLATSARQSLREREIAPNQKRNLCDISTGHLINSAVMGKKALCGLTLSDVRSNNVCPFSLLIFGVTNVFDRLAWL